MTNWFRIGFFASLAFNIILIIGFILFRQSVSTTIYKINVLNADAKVTEARHSLHEIETGDPNKIAALKLYLRESIEMNEREADEYRQAARK